MKTSLSKNFVPWLKSFLSSIIFIPQQFLYNIDYIWSFGVVILLIWWNFLKEGSFLYPNKQHFQLLSITQWSNANDQEIFQHLFNFVFSRHIVCTVTVTRLTQMHFDSKSLRQKNNVTLNSDNLFNWNDFSVWRIFGRYFLDYKK